MLGLSYVSSILDLQLLREGFLVTYNSVSSDFVYPVEDLSFFNVLPIAGHEALMF